MALNNKVNVDDVVVNGVMSAVRKGRSWVGTMTELSDVLASQVNPATADVLPGSTSALRVVLNRVVNRLRSRGVSVKFGRTNDHHRTRYVKFVR